jgi:hypothetical protein
VGARLTSSSGSLGMPRTEVSSLLHRDSSFSRTHFVSPSTVVSLLPLRTRRPHHHPPQPGSHTGRGTNSTIQTRAVLKEMIKAAGVQYNMTVPTRGAPTHLSLSSSNPVSVDSPVTEVSSL